MIYLLTSLRLRRRNSSRGGLLVSLKFLAQTASCGLSQDYRRQSGFNGFAPFLTIAFKAPLSLYASELCAMRYAGEIIFPLKYILLRWPTYNRPWVMLGYCNVGRFVNLKLYVFLGDQRRRWAFLTWRWQKSNWPKRFGFNSRFYSYPAVQTV